MECYSKRNLVIGFATNQDHERVSIFCKTIRNLYREDNCDVVLAVNQPSIYELCRKYNILAMPTLNNWQKHSVFGKIVKKAAVRAFKASRKLGGRSEEFARVSNSFFESTVHPHLGRWFFYKRAMEIMPVPKKVLITDVSDVIFQAPFFEDFQDDRISFFGEADCYGESDWNDENYKKLYGLNDFQKIVGRPVVCMGVLGGGSYPVRKLIDWMIASVYSRPNGGSDQVRGNKYAQLEYLSGAVEILGNGAGSVIHIHDDKLIGEGASSIAGLRAGVVVARGTERVIPIVHMYNRHPKTLESALNFSMSSLQSKS